MNKNISKKKLKKPQESSNGKRNHEKGQAHLIRDGEVTSISYNRTEEEFYNQMESIRLNRPRFKQDIDEKVKELLSLFNQYDPFDILCSVSLKNCFTDPENYKESTHEGFECYMEYAQSLILTCKSPKLENHPTNDIMNRVHDLISEIFMDVQWYFGSEITEAERSKMEEELRFLSMGKYLYLRGNSYEQHHFDLIKGLFEPHDQFLQHNYGLTIKELLLTILEIRDQIVFNINKVRIESNSILLELHELCKKFIDEQPDQFSSNEEFWEKYLAVPQVKKKSEEHQELIKDISKNPFKITPTPILSKDLLNLLSSKLGENEVFLSFKRDKGWPTNDSIIYEKPLIEFNGNYYCYTPQVLIRNLQTIIEKWINAKDPKYYKTKYSKKRSEYLEKKSIEYFTKMLPGAETYNNLFYRVEENEESRVETDGLVIFDENLFIIEAKAGSLAVSARRGSLKAIKTNLKKLIKESYEQALRTKNYIETADQPKFEYENGEIALIIDNKNNFKQIYLVNVTLESLNHLQTNLNSIKSLNLIEGTEWPWSVFIDDLRTISDIIEFPTEFLTFLQRRIRANDYPQFHSADEIDYFMFFLKHGLYFENGILEDADLFIPQGYTEDLDRYYDYLAGRVTSGKKPQLEILENELKQIIELIEKSNKQGFTRITTNLIKLNKPTQQDLIKKIYHFTSLSLRDGQPHNLSIIPGNSDIGITFWIHSTEPTDFWAIDRFCNLKMYQTHFEEWHVILLKFGVRSSHFYDFKIYKEKWKHNREMEKRINMNRTRLLTDFKRKSKNIGRNKPCPCKSGLKYKNCCGNRVKNLRVSQIE